MIKLHNVVPHCGAEVWLKYEVGNPTGSYKYRMAMSVLANAMSRSDVSLGDTVVEYTGGSTGSSLAFVSAGLGLKFVAVCSDASSQQENDLHRQLSLTLLLLFRLKTYSVMFFLMVW